MLSSLAMGGALSWVRAAIVVGATGAAWYGQQILHFGPNRLLGVPVLLVAALVAALAIRWRGEAESRASDGLTPISEAVLVALLLVVGVWARLVDFESNPGAMNHDAAWNGMYATHINGGATFTPYVSAAWGRETSFMYVIAFFQRWFGISLEAVQAAAALVGVLALLPIYLFTRELFGRIAGLASLALFAVSGWHWVFSRVGWRCVTVPPIETIALYALWRALRHGGSLSWLFAGAFTGLSLYTYNAARIVPFMVAGLVLAHFAFKPRRWRELLRGGVIAVAAALVTAGPMLWFAVTNWVKFQGRAAHLLAGSTITANIQHALGLFNYRGNGNDFFVNEPVLDPTAAVFFALGMVLLMTRLRSANARFVVLGLVLSLLPGVVSFPNGNRSITAMPFVFAAAGFGCASAVRVVGGLVSGSISRWVTVGLVLLCGAQGARELYDGYLSDSRRLLTGLSPAATAVGEYLSRFDQNYRTYVVSDRWPRYTLQYLSYTHGPPLEPEIALGRRFEEVEGQINRFGKRGLVLVGDLGAAGRGAREGVKRLFAEVREESVPNPRRGGRKVATAVIVEPKAASRTALWSNATRVLSASSSEPDGAAGGRCFDPMDVGEGFSGRFRLMFPVVPAMGSVRFGFAENCPGGDSVVEFEFSARGGRLGAPGVAVLLVGPDQVVAGRWYDIGLIAEGSGKMRAVIDGKRTELPTLKVKPTAMGGFVFSADEGVAFFVDDIGIAPRAIPEGQAWWRAGPSLEDRTSVYEDFEGLPLGDLSGRTGWNLDGGEWVTRPGPAGAGGESSMVAENAFDGGRGKTAGRFSEPMGLGVDADGNFYVSERLNHRVQKFSRDGTYLSEWGRLGSKPGEFREPLDAQVDGDRLYVMDTWNTRIQIFDLSGNYVSQIGPDPVLGKPRGIFVKDGKVYVANSGRGNILVFDLQGKLLLTMPAEDEEPMKQVVDVVVDSKDRIYVNHSQRNRLEVFSPSGERLGQIPIAGWHGETLKEFYMTIDDEDVIYISDWDLQGVRRVKLDGSEMKALGSKIKQPSGLIRDGDRLVVVSRAGNLLKVIELE